jgi:signal transduction histidine kinase
VTAVPGPGLGLSIVKSIIDAHHGSVHLESEPDIGTTVRLVLPKK